jgi:6-phosphogluconolactonase (cycloisomerase 2 family)
MGSRRPQFFPLGLVVLALVCVAPLQAELPQAATQEFVYTSNFGDGTVSGFSVNSATGKLTKIKGSPFPAGIGAGPLTHGRNGRFLYLALLEQSPGGPCGNDLAQLISYGIAPATGDLSQTDDVTLPDYCPSSAVVDSSGKFVYVALIDFGDTKVGAIAAYESKAGVLTPVGGSPFLSPIEVPFGQQAAIGTLALSHDGTVLYASDPNDSAGILIFDRDTSTGALTFRTTFNSEMAFGAMAITPSGKFLLAAPPSGPGVYEYSIGAGGDLAAVPGSPFASPDNSIVNAVSVSPNGKFVIIAEMGGLVVQSVTPKNGALSLVPGSPFGGGLPPAVTFDPSGDFVYEPGMAYRIDSQTGVLSRISSFKTGSAPEAITAVKP